MADDLICSEELKLAEDDVDDWASCGVLMMLIVEFECVLIHDERLCVFVNSLDIATRRRLPRPNKASHSQRVKALAPKGLSDSKPGGTHLWEEERDGTAIVHQKNREQWYSCDWNYFLPPYKLRTLVYMLQWWRDYSRTSPGLQNTMRTVIVDWIHRND